MMKFTVTALFVAFLLTAVSFYLRPADASRELGLAGYWLAALGVTLATLSEGRAETTDRARRDRERE